MELEKLTKAELIEMVEDRKHLVTTVKHKEKEIEDLKSKNEEDIKAAETRARIKHEGLIKEREDMIEKLQAYIRKQNQNINGIMFQYGALLKTLQGSLDSHIFINEKIIADLKEE